MAAEEAAPVVDDGEEAELDCGNSDVCTKYRCVRCFSAALRTEPATT